MRGTNTVWCEHDEAGFRETFRRVVAGIAGSLRLDDSKQQSFAIIRNATPVFQSVFIDRVGTMPLRITEMREYEAEDGGSVSFLRSMDLLVLEHHNLVGREYSEVEVSDATGNIDFDEVVMTTVDGEGNSQRQMWQLRRRPGGSYEVSLPLDSQSKGRSIPAPSSSPGSWKRGQVAWKFLSDTGEDQMLSLVWDPFVDPYAWQETSWKRLNDGLRLQKEGPGGHGIVTTYDESGCASNSEPADPDNPFGRSERVYSKGKCR